MNPPDEETDKQYDPTPQKLEEARKKGEVAHSVDLTTAAGYGGFLIAAAALGPALVLSMGTLLMTPLGQADLLARDVAVHGGGPLAGSLLSGLAVGLAPWFALPALFALASVIGQQAFVVAPTKLAPKLSRISPLSTFRQKFGRAGLFEFAKSFAKLSVYSVILGIYLTLQIDRIIASVHLPPALVAAELGRLAIGLFGIVLVVALSLGTIDLVFQRAEHIRKNRMSRKEITDEVKHSEGDPMMKQQRRQRGVDLAMNRMIADVPKADVIVVNPTHYAVALQWDRAAAGAPKCVAKGVDEVAATIRRIAMDHGVPVHSDPPTARALHATVAIGQEIAPDHYRAVAAAIRFADRIRRKAGQR